MEPFTFTKDDTTHSGTLLWVPDDADDDTGGRIGHYELRVGETLRPTATIRVPYEVVYEARVDLADDIRASGMSDRNTHHMMGWLPPFTMEGDA